MKPDRQKLCTKWSYDPIILEARIRKAEQDGWMRSGLPKKQQYGGTNIPIGSYMQLLKKGEQ